MADLALPGRLTAKSAGAGPSQTQSSDRIAIFSPTTLLTVTLESGPDECPALHIDAGGQGSWVASMIARLGASAVLCTPLGGDAGRLLRTLIASANVEIQAIETAGSNGSYVHDRRSGERIEICRIDGAKLDRHETDDLYNATLAVGLNSRLLVLTGQATPVLPATVYRRLASDFRNNERLVIADLSGVELEEGLQGGIDVLCFSHEELVRNGYAPSKRPEDLVAGMERLHRLGAECIVLHRGKESTIVRIEGELFEVIAPQVTPLDHRGGGDTFFAMLAVGLMRNESLDTTIRLAAAAGTLNVTRHGLGTARFEDIEPLSQQVRIQPWALQG